MGAELTVRQKILVAAASLGSDTEAFGVEELIVKTWTLFPEAFSLRNYAGKYPDSNRVLAKLSGNDGLCGMGWLEHVDSRMYSVTRKGRLLARQLSAMQAGTAPGPGTGTTSTPPAATEREKPERAPRVAKEKPLAEKPAKEKPAKEKPVAEKPLITTVIGVQLSAKDIYALEQVVKADALRKFLRGQSLSFLDACAFWGFTPSSRPAAVAQRLEETADLLKRAVESFGTEGGPAPRMPPLATCFGLMNLHRLMAEKFARELDALRSTAAAG